MCIRDSDRLRLGPALGGPRELEGVAHEVGVLDDLVALVEVAQHDDAFAECLPRGADPGVELLVGGPLVLLGDAALHGGVGRDGVVLRCAGAVGG